MVKNRFDYLHFKEHFFKSTQILHTMMIEYNELFNDTEDIESKKRILKRSEALSDVLYGITQLAECYNVRGTLECDLEVLKNAYVTLKKQNELYRQGI